MTFSIVAAGTVDQAKAQVEAATAYGPDEQFNQVKAFILEQLTYPQSPRSDDDFDSGVFIEASGHNGYGAPPYVALSIRPLTLRKPKTAEVEVAE